MHKTTIELARTPGHTAGYGFVSGWPMTSEKDVLEWSRAPANHDKRVYRHLVRTGEENVDTNKWTYAPEHHLSDRECAALFADKPLSCRSLTHQMGMVYRMPTCDAMTWLDIYWQ